MFGSCFSLYNFAINLVKQENICWEIVTFLAYQGLGKGLRWTLRMMIAKMRVGAFHALFIIDFVPSTIDDFLDLFA